MPKDLTTKDVLYALQYMGDALVRVPINDGNARWEMQIGRRAVKERVANEVRASGSVVGVEDHGRQLIIWKQAA